MLPYIALEQALRYFLKRVCTGRRRAPLLFLGGFSACGETHLACDGRCCPLSPTLAPTNLASDSAIGLTAARAHARPCGCWLAMQTASCSLVPLSQARRLRAPHYRVREGCRKHARRALVVLGRGLLRLITNQCHCHCHYCVRPCHAAPRSHAASAHCRLARSSTLACRPEIDGQAPRW